MNTMNKISFINLSGYKRTMEQIAPKRSLTPYFLTITLFSALIHLLVAVGGPVGFTYDSRHDYIPSIQALERNEFHLNELEIQRTAGYPVFAWLFSSHTSPPDFARVKYVQQFLGILIDIMTFFIAYLLCGNALFSLLVTLIKFVSFDAVLFQNFIMTDTLYSFLLTLSCLLCLIAFRYRNGIAFVGAMPLFGLSSCVRPLGALIWIFPVAAWGLLMVVQNAKKNPFQGWQGRLRIRHLLDKRSLLICFLGVMVFFLTRVPLIVSDHDRNIALPQKFATLWIETIMFNDYYSDAFRESPYAQEFFDDYQKWLAENKLHPKSHFYQKNKHYFGDNTEVSYFLA